MSTSSQRMLPAHLLSVSVSDDLSIHYIQGGDRRRGVEAVLEQHYTGRPGNAGYLFAVVTAAGEVLGGCLVGGTASEAQKRSLIAAPWPVRVIKRLWCDNACPVPESQLLRFSMAAVANLIGQSYLCVAYADPAARDLRTGQPLTGRVYQSAGFYFAGFTQPRRALVDAAGCIRSPRQGKQTLTLATTPPGWEWMTLPPALIWETPVSPTVYWSDGTLRPTSVRWRSRERRRVWAAVKHPVAAKQWLPHKAWFRLRRAGRVPLYPLDPSHEVCGPLRRQNALWQGADLHRSAAPVFPPLIWQDMLVPEPEDERTANRAYRPTALHSSGTPTPTWV